MPYICAGHSVTDLYAFSLPQLATIQKPGNVHFTKEGSTLLAEEVAKQASTFVSDTSYLLGGDLTETRDSLQTFITAVEEYRKFAKATGMPDDVLAKLDAPVLRGN